MSFSKYPVVHLASLLLCAMPLNACSEEADIVDPWAVSSTYPQISSVILHTKRLETKFRTPREDAFNPGMVTWNGDVWMALRVDRFGDGAREGCDVERTIVMARLDADFEIQADYFPIVLPHPGQPCSTAEDPRLVADGEHLYMVYNGRSLLEDEASGVRRMFFAELAMNGGAPHPLYVRQLESPSYPLRHLEKNWTPFISDAGVHLIYNSDPPVTFLLSRALLTCLRQAKTPIGVLNLTPPAISTAEAQPVGLYGARRGGTQAIFDPKLDLYVSFSHSWVANEHGQRLYFAGFYTFSPVPPFDMVSYLPQPLDIPCVSPKRNGFYKVVFPSGLVDLGDKYMISFGEEDLIPGLSLINKAQLLDELVLVQSELM
jgi:hypothetical protein